MVFIAATAAGFGFLVFFLNRRLRNRPEDKNALILLQNQMNEVTRTLDLKLGESTKLFQKQFGESAKIIRDVT